MARAGERGELVGRMVKTLTQGSNFDDQEPSPNCGGRNMNNNSGVSEKIYPICSNRQQQSSPSGTNVRKSNPTTSHGKCNLNSSSAAIKDSNMMRTFKHQATANDRPDGLSAIRFNSARPRETASRCSHDHNQDDNEEDEEEENQSDDDERYHKRHRAPTTGVKLVNSASRVDQSTNAVSNQRNHHLHHTHMHGHKPHCMHHNPNCRKHSHYSHQQIEETQIKRLQNDYDPRKPPAPPMPAGLLGAKPHPREQPYLLVEYLPPRLSNKNGPIIAKANKRTTLSFISQLYFLLHLSAILSLLLHHKNLVASDRRLLISTQSWPPIVDLTGADRADHKGNTTKQPWSQPEMNIVASLSQPMPTVDELPVPQMQRQPRHQPQQVDAWQTNNHGINSYLASSDNQWQQVGPRVAHQAHSYHRNTRQTQPPVAQSDILVRMVGWWHAKHALQYFLCYLLSSSVIILICLWLFRIFDRSAHYRMLVNSTIISGPGANSRLADRSGAQRTYLDCTPVLIGSISLGLIQLIVIGLDIAGNVDWLGDARWPIYLPFLQFAFVSLLMQFILSRVAKNSSNRPNGYRSTVAWSINSRQMADSGFSLSSTASSPTAGEPRQTTIAGAAMAAKETPSAPSQSPMSNGLQNIALAHLLVTHILLWLMRLNSITLFQPIVPQFATTVTTHLHSNHLREQQQSAIGHFGSASPPPYWNVRPNNLTANAANDSHSSLPIKPTQQQAPAVATKPATRQFYSLDMPTMQMAADSNEQQQFNRTELEAMLRRKIPKVETTPAPQQQPPVPLNVPSSTRIPKPVAGNDRVQHDIAPVKNERGLRSASGLPRPSEEPTRPWNITQLNEELTHGPHGGVGDPNFANKSITLTQAELLNLIKLATQKNTQQLPAQGPQIASSNQPKVMLSNNISASFKSSLPKRQMTAFRQARPQTYSVASNVSLPLSSPTSITSASLMNKRPTGSVGPTSSSAPAISFKPVSSSTTTTTSTTRRPKQRARISVTRTVEHPLDLSTVIAVSAPEDRQPRAFKANRTIDSSTVPPTTERPFPSVESDPPTEEIRTTAEPIQEDPTTSQVTTPTLPVKPTTSPFASERSSSSIVMGPVTESPTEASATDALSENELAIDGDDDSSNNWNDDNDDAEMEDLAAQLPPVPDYNETATSEDPNVALKDEPTKRKARLLPDPLKVEEARNLSQGSSFSEVAVAPIQEELSVFNEAASISVNVTTLAPELPRVNLTIKFNSTFAEPGSVPASAEPLIMPDPQTMVHEQPLLQPSFADYLLPIVHQYHILVIAILFHMWLDSLRQRAPTHPVKRRRRGNPNVGDYGMAKITHASSKRLIAIPMGQNGRQKIPGSYHNLEIAGKRDINPSKWHHLNELMNYKNQRCKSKSLDHLNQPLDLENIDGASNASSVLASPTHQSLRSSSSEQLLWIPDADGHRNRSGAIFKHRVARFRSSQDSFNSRSGSERGGRYKLNYREQCIQDGDRYLAGSGQPVGHSETGNSSACSVFFGLLIISASLIVMLLGVELLSTLTQCFTQLLSILVCLIGLCIVWRAPVGTDWRADAHPKQQMKQLSSNPTAISPKKSPSQAIGVDHRQCFHYLFLLAAYYCGLSTSLNLGRQNSIEQFFPQQVIQFVQRHIITNAPHHLLIFNFARHSSDLGPPATINFQLLFHALVVIKGIILVVQVTLQTMLIRSSCRKAHKIECGNGSASRTKRLELRQIYTFLMFANLSLWALDICEQQRRLQHDMLAQQQDPEQLEESTNFELITLDGFTRFANSIVTLSHLYHGLVFLQQ